MPGLIRGVARTAVVAGTATAVSNRVSRRQASRWGAQEQQQYEHEQYVRQQNAQLYPQPASPQPSATPPAAAPQDMSGKIEQLKQLGELRSQGVLTEAEFEHQKALLLNS